MTNEELVARIQGGQDRAECLKELCDTNRPLIAYLANRYSTGLEDQQDLMQQGYVGLIEAARAFDQTAGASFSTFAVYWIKSEIFRYITGGIIHFSNPQRARIRRYQNFITDFQRDHGRKPTTAEVINSLGLTAEQVRKVETDAIMLTIRSTSELIDDDGLELAETIAADQEPIEDTITSRELARILWGIVDDLEPMEADIIKRRYRDQQPWTSCADAMGLALPAARKLEGLALRNLRKKSRALKSYRDDYITDHLYRHYKFSDFKYTGQSEPEWIVLNKGRI